MQTRLGTGMDLTHLEKSLLLLLQVLEILEDRM
jgi:hypothetical protein